MERFLVVFVFIFSSFILYCNGEEFYVGGEDGWVLNKRFDRWGRNHRFQVNDTLYFKYEKGRDSVLLVSQDDYVSCNTMSPVAEMNDGVSKFKLNHVGPFFFISGVLDHCLKGQKLLAVVVSDTSPVLPSQSPKANPSYPPEVPMISSPPESNSPSPAPSKSNSPSRLGYSAAVASSVVSGLGLVLCLVVSRFI